LKVGIGGYEVAAQEGYSPAEIPLALLRDGRLQPEDVEWVEIAEGDAGMQDQSEVPRDGDVAKFAVVR